MNLQCVLTPGFASARDTAAISINDMFGKSSPRTTLVARENLKEYSVISDVGRT